ncbi:hypothetical protein E4H12_12805 [Candidatus Thorarchaeota archaeon]|nr:MAG: hypothetical protein E4H12_12805 [Candidatus Thorarchaeota archaeon]
MKLPNIEWTYAGVRYTIDWGKTAIIVGSFVLVWLLAGCTKSQPPRCAYQEGQTVYMALDGKPAQIYRIWRYEKSCKYDVRVNAGGAAGYQELTLREYELTAKPKGE